MNPVIGIDPGRQKCGVAVVAPDLRVLWKAVVDTPELATIVAELAAKFHSVMVVMGDGTSSGAARRALEAALMGRAVTLEIVDEYRTTDAAKARYWQEQPPRSWRQLIPVTMQVPPVPVDDYVAVILAERYLEKAKK